jgi:hypothetical protein
MPDDLQPPSSASTIKSGRSAGARVILIIAVVAVIARLLLALLSHHGHASTNTAGTLPSWPLKQGDTFTLKPGDPAIAKWAESPDSDGFIVQLLDADGKPIEDAQGSVGIKVCALMPDYMADADQPGGTLTLVSQDGTGDWRVHWHGGDTMPAADAPTTTDASADDSSHHNATCGKDATFTMSLAQLHAWYNMQAGIVAPQATSSPVSSNPGSPEPASTGSDTTPTTSPSDSTATH